MQSWLEQEWTAALCNVPARPSCATSTIGTELSSMSNPSASNAMRVSPPTSERSNDDSVEKKGTNGSFVDLFWGHVK
jgi:hypothetical protein